MGSARAILNLVRKTVSPALISPDRFDRVLEVGNRFPDLITPHFICECRLGQGMPQVDLELCIDLRLHGGTLIQHLQRGRPLTGGAHDAELARFLRAWKEDRHQLRDVLSHLWLEMNLGGSAASSSSPGVFFAPLQHLRARPSNGRGQTETADLLLSFTNQVIGSLRGADFVRSYQAGYQRVLDVLPAEARVFQIGAMETAAGPSLKLYLLNLEREGLYPFLERIGWPGNVRRVDDLLRRTMTSSLTFALGLDICGSLSPRLGIELYPPADAMTVRGLIESLVWLGACDEAKGRALESYPGVVRERESEDWPFFLKQMAVFLKKETRGIVRKRINHFKLVVEGNRPVEAKVYLSAFQTWEM